RLRAVSPAELGSSTSGGAGLGRDEHVEGKRDDASPLLRVENLAISFLGLRALDGVSLAVSPGRILGLVGPNGSGKSTLVNVVCGIYRADAGRVTFDGGDITGLSDDRVARRGIIRTFQDPRLVPGFTVRENVLLG